MAALRGVVFDMDDTLYLERDYVRTGFQAVAASLENEQAFDFLWGHFLKGTRGNTFDLLASELGPSIDVSSLVETYRSHRPVIDLLPEYRPLVAELQELGLPVGLITDGHATPQRNKAEALGLPGLLKDLVLTGEWGAEYSKPHHRAYRHYADLWGIAPESLVYIGDNPKKDFVAPNELGWRSIRLRMPGGIYEGDEPAGEQFAATIEVSSPAELGHWLHEWRNR
jgi:putative hydrolase of the HAD superfamily